MWPITSIILLLFLSSPILAQTCNENIPESTPDSRFTINNNSTVEDHKTGLMWKRCPEGASDEYGFCTFMGKSPINGYFQYTWDKALAYAENYEFAGYQDWRLPNIKELFSIIELKCTNPARNITVFPATRMGSANKIWSSSPTFEWGRVWYIGGNGHIDSPVGRCSLRLVRDIGG